VNFRKAVVKGMTIVKYIEYYIEMDEYDYDGYWKGVIERLESNDIVIEDFDVNVYNKIVEYDVHYPSKIAIIYKIHLNLVINGDGYTDNDIRNIIINGD